MPAKPMRRSSRRYVEPSMTQMVLRSFFGHTHKTAFKIIPRDRIPNIVMEKGGTVFEWGKQVFFSGGLLGSLVAMELACCSKHSDISSIYWEMEGEEEGRMHKLFSVIIRSSGTAERYPRDPLILEHLPAMADSTLAAHVFHFYRQAEAMLFDGILRSWIDQFSETMQ